MPRGIDPAFGDRLQRLRNLRGWTQRELAERAGVSKRSLEAYEGGRVPRTALPALAEALGVSAHVLAHGEQMSYEQLRELGGRLEALERRISQLEETLAGAADAQRRVWFSLDATLRLLLAQVASRDVLAQIPEPPGIIGDPVDLVDEAPRLTEGDGAGGAADVQERHGAEQQGG